MNQHPTSATRAILSIGGGPQQLPLIDAARSLGLGLIVVDRDPDAPCMHRADHAIVLSTHDTPGVVAALRALPPGLNLSGVVARTTGKALETAAVVAAEFGLRGLTREVVRLATSKSELRAFCESHGFPMPRGERLEQPGPVALPMPLVVKPDYTVVGKRDVRRVESGGDLADAIQSASKASFNGAVEVEEFVDGVDVACVFRCASAEAQVLALYDEVLGFSSSGTLEPVAIATPSRLTAAARSSVHALVQRFAEALGTVDAILILCLRANARGTVRIIELHADLGGDRIADELLPVAHPYLDYFRCVVQVAVGDEPVELEFESEAEPAILFARSGATELVQPASAEQVQWLLAAEIERRDEIVLAPEQIGDRPQGVRPRAILLIGGSALQLPCMRHARALGLNIVLTDSNENCAGRPSADEFHQVSGSDVDALMRVAVDAHTRFDLIGAYCGSDFGLPAVSAIHNELGLGGVTPENIERALNKNVMLTALRAAGLPLAEGETVSDSRELNATTERLGFPVILKPTGGSGSRGVTTVFNASGLEPAWEAAHEVSHAVVVERLVSGRHLDVNGLFLSGGAFHRCGTMERFFSPPPIHVPLMCLQPSGIERELEDQCYDLVERGARALGIDAGPVKADVILTAEGPIVLEIGPRFQGDVITGHLTEHANGSRPIRAHFAALAGHRTPEQFLRTTHDRVAGWRALYPRMSGRLERVEGFEDALRSDGIVHGLLSVRKGARVGPARDTTATAGFLWAVGDTAEDVRVILDSAVARVRFVTEADTGQSAA